MLLDGAKSIFQDVSAMVEVIRAASIDIFDWMAVFVFVRIVVTECVRIIECVVYVYEYEYVYEYLFCNCSVAEGVFLRL